MDQILITKVQLFYFGKNSVLVMTLLLRHSFQETGAEDQVGQSKKNALQQNIAINGIYQKSTTFQHLEKSHIQHLSPTNS